MQKNKRQTQILSDEKIKNLKISVCKFGGTSLANCENIKRVAQIIKSGKKRFVVVSAPGKREKNDTKITDILINCFNLSKNGLDFSSFFEEFKSRFLDIVRELCVEINLIFDFCNLKNEIEIHKNYDFVISRGEYILAKIVAKYLSYTFLDAKDFLCFDEKKEVDLFATKNKFEAIINPKKYYVIPGFYGENAKGEIVTFSRGGSDVTGAIVAYLTKAKVYENFTDVDGFFSANPMIISSPKMQKNLTYDELRALSFFGASVLHPDCAKFLKENNIVLNLKNTFNTTCSGSFIFSKVSKKIKEIAGISGEKNYYIVTLKKFNVQNDFSALCQIENIIKKFDLTAFLLNISLDEIAIVFKKVFLSESFMQMFLSELKSQTNCEKIEVKNNVVIISVVGEAIKNFKAVERKVVENIYEADKNIFFLNKALDANFICFAIDEKKFDNVINRLYKSFF
ncbi:MAG: hypothetical protein EOM55_02370 [Clostridia bacterium]|nr:hypothetical protein [Clostridia bacterium]